MDNATVDPRPKLTLQQATELTLQLYGVTITEISTLPSYYDQNFLVVDKEGTQFVLKIMNSEESKDVTLLEVQTLAMSFLRQHGFPAQTAVVTTTGELMSMEEIDCGHGAQTYCVRLLTYLPGKPIAESPVTTQDLYHVGKLIASMDKTLQQLVSPNLDVLQRNNDTTWSLSNIPLVEDCLSVMDGDPLHEVIEAVIEQYKSHVQPKIRSFQQGIIHGDTNDWNIIVRPTDSGNHEVTGVLDFSLLMNNCYVFELAVTIAYVMLENPSPLAVGGALLAGFESVMVLSDDERDSLFLLVLGRLCQSLVYGRCNAKKDPDNAYIRTTAKSGTRLLTKLWELGKREVERKWFTDASTFSDNYK